MYHALMGEGRKRVLAIVAVSPWRGIERRRTIFRLQVESTDGVVSGICHSVGGADHAKNRQRFFRFRKALVCTEVAEEGKIILFPGKEKHET
jgi:hypothetical protein